ncbi:MAG: hypothetical protein IPK19_37100 [Chloroflexi bacterium]|nr:hypothetical protein [Chloroflexota bacterium]
MAVGALAAKEALVYDPLRLSESTIEAILRRQELRPVRDELAAFLETKPGKTAPVREVQAKYGSLLYELLAVGGIVR